MRHLTGMSIDKQATRLDNIFSLVVEQANVTNVGLQSIDTECENSCRCTRVRIKFCGCFIDADIRCLRRENDRNQKLKRLLVLKLGGWRRRAFAQYPEDGCTFFLVHG